MNKKELLKLLDNEYNFDNQEAWDKCGFNVGINLEEDISGIVIALDLTQNTIEKALENQANVIITHHPLFLNDPNTLKDNLINIELYKQINEHKIMHIVLHTCFDKHKKGTSYQIAKAITSAKINQYELDPYINWFELDIEISLKFFLQRLRKTTCLNMLKFDKKMENKMLKRIAVIGGSGSSMMDKVLEIEPKIDCFLTGDIKWHGFIDAQANNLAIVDIGHDAEQIFVKTIKKFLENSDLKLYEVGLSVELVGVKCC